MFPGADPAGLDLLQRMIVFNPANRITLQQALEHPFLTGVRQPAAEVSSPWPCAPPGLTPPHCLSRLWASPHHMDVMCHDEQVTASAPMPLEVMAENPSRETLKRKCVCVITCAATCPIGLPLFCSLPHFPPAHRQSEFTKRSSSSSVTNSACVEKRWPEPPNRKSSENCFSSSTGNKNDDNYYNNNSSSKLVITLPELAAVQVVAQAPQQAAAPMGRQQCQCQGQCQYRMVRPYTTKLQLQVSVSAWML